MIQRDITQLRSYKAERTKQMYNAVIT